jgi:hypothetical protein
LNDLIELLGTAAHGSSSGDGAPKSRNDTHAHRIAKLTQGIPDGDGRLAEIEVITRINRQIRRILAVYPQKSDIVRRISSHDFRSDFRAIVEQNGVVSLIIFNDVLVRHQKTIRGNKEGSPSSDFLLLRPLLHVLWNLNIELLEEWIAGNTEVISERYGLILQDHLGQVFRNNDAGHRRVRLFHDRNDRLFLAPDRHG